MCHTVHKINVSKHSKTDYDTVRADYNDFTQSLLLTIIVISENSIFDKGNVTINMPSWLIVHYQYIL